MNIKQVQAHITSARFWALSHTNRDVCFYGALACSLADIIDPSVETACTNGKVIKWSPDFVAKLYADGLDAGHKRVRFVLLHEVAHCGHGHFWRLPLTTEGNIAGDYVINRMLRDVPGIEAPEGALDDVKFDALAEEEVLAALRQPPKPQPPKPGKPGDDGDGEAQGGPSDGPSSPSDDEGEGQGTPGDGKAEDRGGCGGFEAPADDAQQGEAKAIETLRKEWEEAVVQAAQVAQSMAQGNLPAGARRMLERIAVKARADWRAETAEFVRSTIASTPDWSRQARRTATAPVIYPRRRRDDLGTVVFVRDTSGSISPEIIAAFNEHIAHIVAETGCSALVLDADAKVQAEYRLTPGDELPTQAEGGGGTDFRPAFARVAELEAEGERIAGLVYLTDLLGYFPRADDASIQTLWVATTDQSAPFGRTVRVEV